MIDDLDTRFGRASSSLDMALDDVVIPEPRSRKTSTWIPLAAASLIGVLVVGAVVATRDTGSVDVLQPADTSAATASAQPADEVLRVTASEAGEVTAPVASITQAFNTDGSLALLYRTGPDGGEHVVYDTSTWAEVRVLDLTAATDIEDIFWNPDVSSMLHYIDTETMTVNDVDAVSGAASVSHTFNGCDAVGFGGTSGTSTSGSARVAVVCSANDQDLWVAYDLAERREIARGPAPSGDAPVAFASGDGFVTIADGRVDVLDAELAPTGITIDVEVSSYALAVVDGRDVLAATVFDGDENTIGTVVTFDLESGQRTVVIGPQTGWQYPPGGSTMSAAAGSVIAITTSPDLGDAEPDRLDDIVATVDLATGEITIVASHAMANGDRFGNWSSPFVAISPDGESVLFSTDQGTDRVDTFRADVP